MTDRRRANRFVLPPRTRGSLRIMEDVYVERADAGEITVVGVRPIETGEDLLLDLAPGAGRRRALRVRALRCAATRFAEGVRHRAVLAVASGQTFSHGTLSTPAAVDRPWCGIGVLVRRIALSVTEVSANGCLIESDHRLPEGTVGVLDLFVEHTGRGEEALRICRTVRLVGAARPFAAGAEFLPIGPPTPTSVRNLIARLEMVLELDSSTGDGAVPPSLPGDAEAE